MNIQAYIASGILEEYVLGTVSPQEKQEVECMSHIYPEIKAELMRTEDALEQYALKYQTPPPASVKESLFAQLNFDEQAAAEDVEIPFVAAPAEERIVPIPVVERPEPEIRTVTVAPIWSWISVAAAVLLALFAGWSASQLTDLRASNDRMVSEMAGMRQTVAYTESLAGLYRNPDFKVVRMTGIPAKSPESLVAAFWNQKTNEVMIDVSKLPNAPEGKQYQLWSIVDGVPVDIGMLEQDFNGKVLTMKPTKSGAVAFAITLEKTGGNPTPTMEEMYVMGKV